MKEISFQLRTTNSTKVSNAYELWKRDPINQSTFYFWDTQGNM